MDLPIDGLMDEDACYARLPVIVHCRGAGLSGLQGAGTTPAGSRCTAGTGRRCRTTGAGRPVPRLRPRVQRVLRHALLSHAQASVDDRDAAAGLCQSGDQRRRGAGTGLRPVPSAGIATQAAGQRGRGAGLRRPCAVDGRRRGGGRRGLRGGGGKKASRTQNPTTGRGVGETCGSGMALGTTTARRCRAWSAATPANGGGKWFATAAGPTLSPGSSPAPTDW